MPRKLPRRAFGATVCADADSAGGRRCRLCSVTNVFNCFNLFGQSEKAKPVRTIHSESTLFTFNVFGHAA
eukprot:5958640-Alexandrium_andersonii.AAC.1